MTSNWLTGWLIGLTMIIKTEKQAKKIIRDHVKACDFSQLVALVSFIHPGTIVYQQFDDIFYKGGRLQPLRHSGTWDVIYYDKIVGWDLPKKLAQELALSLTNGGVVVPHTEDR